MSKLFLREWRSANERAANSTPDIFSANRFKIFGIRRALIKLGASATIDLETLNARELETLRVEIANQLSSRKRGDNPTEQTTATKTEK